MKDKTRQRVNKGVWRDPRRLYGEIDRTLCASVCSSNPAGCDSRSACLRFSKGFLLLSSAASCFATARCVPWENSNEVTRLCSLGPNVGAPRRPGIEFQRLCRCAHPELAAG